MWWLYNKHLGAACLCQQWGNTFYIIQFFTNKCTDKEKKIKKYYKAWNNENLTQDKKGTKHQDIDFKFYRRMSHVHAFFLMYSFQFISFST